ncbi:sodium/potassium-transporting ATPase subunit beta-3-like isoform X1 [Hippoglossus hippoglossus]|uniref:sodium/potassium-transporting ATPase subunit beta-3-like isoform X1 n=1 Tax=Hippoglossus hippoglossus TaxID=8267 RepID=UPI00148E47D3|nr:sodium/potassium-transporting ATPase subunit beta-3-like isoform X1 [Hippoglossus hippoglossus]
MSSSPQNQDQKLDRDRDQDQDQDQDQKQDQGQKQDRDRDQKREGKEGKEVKNEKMKKEKQEEKESFNYFIYNPTTREFMGRTASSWGRILLFYLIFYGFLAGMFSFTMWVMLLTLDDNVPRHQDRVANPGLVIRPHAAEISFNRSDPTNYNQYIQQLHELLQRYNDSIQKRHDLCLVGEYTEQDEEPIKKVCQFKRSALRQCSGLFDTSFGYADGKPCVIIKMNRVIGLKPQGDPFINCTAKGDRPLQIQYFPSEGRLDKMFFPYYGKKAHPDYVQPLVAVKLFLTKDNLNVEQTVECKVQGSDLRNDDDRDKFQGRVTFRVKVTE